MKVVWERIGGNEDLNSPHIIYLNENDLLLGNNKNIIDSNKPLLNDGTIYNIQISLIDFANNYSDDFIIENVIYDITPPEIIASYPIPSSIISSSMISFSLTENLNEGKIIWNQIGGEVDNNSPHEIILNNFVKTKGLHDSTLFSQQINLKNGSVYNIVFLGEDLAENEASGMTIENIEFDDGPPILTIDINSEYNSFNSPSFNYSISEDLSYGKIIFENTSGVNDSNSPHIISISNNELLSGQHIDETLSTEPILIHDGIYKITFSGADNAGNEASEVSIVEMKFDNILPVGDISYPLPFSIINDHEVNYTLSENLKDGYAIWTQIFGNDDLSSPRKIKMKVNEMQAGEISTIFAQPEPLINGAIYNLSLQLIDEAGNISNQNIVEELIFDIEPPQFADIKPLSGFSNTQEISFNLNEDIQSGSIIFQESGSSLDPSSPHTYVFEEYDLIKGEKLKILNQINIELFSGSNYKLIFKGIDIAGNESESIESEIFTFDVESPSLIVSFPENNIVINEPKLSFQTSEEFKNLKAIWTSDNGQEVEQIIPSDNLNGTFENFLPNNSPSLIDGSNYTLSFNGLDLADNALSFESISNILFDTTTPKIKVKLSGPSQGLFVHNSPIEISLSENMSEVKFVWEREGGSEDLNSPHTLFLSNDDLSLGEKSKVLISGLENVLIGTSYTLSVNGKDKAGNESTTQKLENIEIVKELSGDWIYQGIAVIAWSFTDDKKFNQGVLFGNTLSDQKPGTYAIDWGKKPFRLAIKYDDGTKRFGLFEFIGHNKLRVVSSSDKKPSNWTDGDYFEFEYRENAVP